MLLLWSIVLCSLTVMLTTAFHYEALLYLNRFAAPTGKISRRRAPAILLALVTAHIVEIGLYAVVYALAAGPLGLGSFSGEKTMAATDYFYYAAETYSSLGYGDIFPLGEIRLIASIGPLNGILLLAWSGSFLFGVVQHSTVKRDRNRGA